MYLRNQAKWNWTDYILTENKILNACDEEEKRWNELENGGSHKKEHGNLKEWCVYHNFNYAGSVTKLDHCKCFGIWEKNIFKNKQRRMNTISLEKRLGRPLDEHYKTSNTWKMIQEEIQ